MFYKSTQRVKKTKHYEQAFLTINKTKTTTTKLFKMRLYFVLAGTFYAKFWIQHYNIFKNPKSKTIKRTLECDALLTSLHRQLKAFSIAFLVLETEHFFIIGK